MREKHAPNKPLDNQETDHTSAKTLCPLTQGHLPHWTWVASNGFKLFASLSDPTFVMITIRAASIINDIKHKKHLEPIPLKREGIKGAINMLVSMLGF
jgi:hypothetical protein